MLQSFLIQFPLKMYTHFFGSLTESCLGSIYIHKSIAPLAMNLAFLAQKTFFDLVLLGDFLKILPINILNYVLVIVIPYYLDVGNLVLPYYSIVYLYSILNLPYLIGLI
jgi:hypothetical protein